MAEFTAWIATDKVGSECRQPFEVPDEELEGLAEQERYRIIRDYAREAAFDMCEWGYDDIAMS